MTSAEMTHSQTLGWSGIWYMTSFMISSRMAFRPRVLRLIASLAIACSASA